MPTTKPDLLAVCVDGETKTGKGAASKAIAAVLKQQGYNVYYDVAGDFYRRYVALVRLELGLTDADSLPTGEPLLKVARVLYENKRAFELSDSLGNLQRPAISQSVAVLAELPLVQQAGAEWWAMTLKQAVHAGTDILVVDGRNPRSRVRDASVTSNIQVLTVLDLYMTCEAREAARRTLRLQGFESPTTEELDAASEKVLQRRTRDRERADTPFIVPEDVLSYDPKNLPAKQVVQNSWGENVTDPPLTITLDNTHFTEQEMLAAVSELAVEAVQFDVDNS